MTILAGLMMAGLLAAGPAPDMRVNVGDLKMSRPGDAAILTARIKAASQDWCASNRGLLTPSDIGMPRICEREMRRRALWRLPAAERRLFVRAGGARALNRF